jgi:hypothetical protein
MRADDLQPSLDGLQALGVVLEEVGEASPVSS